MNLILHSTQNLKTLCSRFLNYILLNLFIFIQYDILPLYLDCKSLFQVKVSYTCYNFSQVKAFFYPQVFK